MSGISALTLLRDDHQKVKKLFKDFKAASPGAHATVEKLAITIRKELVAHAMAEEQVLYPRLRDRLKQRDEDGILEALEEHHVVKLLLAELQNMNDGDERFRAKATVLMENVEHHIGEEEREMFPMARRFFTRGELVAMGDEMVGVKSAAPTRARPDAPDEPPGVTIAGVLGGSMDRVRDALNGSDDAEISGRPSPRQTAKTS